jgi:methionine biosynthesis protein MetW
MRLEPATGTATAPAPYMTEPALRFDLRLIADMIEPHSRVLDIGCGDGALLAYLAREKSVDGRGIEISQEGVNACVTHGLSVIQGDADTDLSHYPSDAFDYVVLSKTLQATRYPQAVLEDLVRIGRHAVVSFVNFGHWRARLNLLLRGRMPVTAGPDYGWYDSPDIHLCTILDFVEVADALGLTIEKCLSLTRRQTVRVIRTAGHVENLRGEQAVFLLRRG